MKYYTMVNEDGEYSGITTVKSDRMRYTDVPVKPITGYEKAVFNFDTNEWEYEFEQHEEEIEESIYYNLSHLVISKDSLIKYKLYMSKKRTPLTSYSKNQFIVTGDIEIADFMYANKTFDVVFLKELSFYNIFDDNGIDMVINKDILPEIEELKGYDLLVYLLDNYSCFIENNESEYRTNKEIKEQLYKSAEHNELLKKQIEVAEENQRKLTEQ